MNHHFLLHVVMICTAVTFARAYEVYWNVPSDRCFKHGVHIHPEEYGFSVNKEQGLIGEKMALFYNPGRYPQYKKDGTVVNGGIPQKGNLTEHLTALKARIEKELPNKKYAGLAVIDFEEYQPFFDVSHKLYRDKSIEFARRLNPNGSDSEIFQEAKTGFETAARKFIERSLMTALEIRPSAQWGYYQYPLCGNLHIAGGHCIKIFRDNNDNLEWLYKLSAAVYPSLYVFKKGMTEKNRRLFVEGHIKEVVRLRLTSLAYPYTWFQYHDEESYITEEDMRSQLIIPKKYGLPGAIVWGSYDNVANRSQCERLLNYTAKVLGPIVKGVVGLGHDDSR